MAIGKDALRSGLKSSKSSKSANDAFLEMIGLDSQSEQGNSEIELSLLDWHEEQSHFSMNADELQWLAENILAVGVLDPIHLQPREDGRYRILAGHRRTEAAKLAGMVSIPAKIHTDIDDATADIIFTATNLGSRSELLPSEKAFAYAKLEKAIADKGATSCRTTAAIAQATGDNARKIQRYKRLNKLIPELLGWVDEKELTFVTAVSLSYFSPLSQDTLYSFMKEYGIRVTQNQADSLKDCLNEDGELTTPFLEKHLFPKPTPVTQNKKRRIIKLPLEVLHKYFPEDTEDSTIIECILSALEKQAGAT